MIVGQRLDEETRKYSVLRRTIMPTSVWLGTALIASAFPVLYWSLNQRSRGVGQAVHNLGDHTKYNLRVAQLEVPLAGRLGLPIAAAIGGAGRTLPRPSNGSVGTTRTSLVPESWGGGLLNKW